MPAACYVQFPRSLPKRHLRSGRASVHRAKRSPNKCVLSIICSVISTRGCGLARTTLIFREGSLASSAYSRPCELRRAPGPNRPPEMCFFIKYLICNFNVGLWLGTGTSRMHRWRMRRPRCPFVAGARLRSSQTPLAGRPRFGFDPNSSEPLRLRIYSQWITKTKNITHAFFIALSSLFCAAATNCPIRWAHRTTQQAPRRPRL